MRPEVPPKTPEAEPKDPAQGQENDVEPRDQAHVWSFNRVNRDGVRENREQLTAPSIVPDGDPLILSRAGDEDAGARLQICCVELEIRGPAPPRVLVPINARAAVRALRLDEKDIPVHGIDRITRAGIGPENRIRAEIHAADFGVQDLYDVALRQRVVQRRGNDDEDDNPKKPANINHGTP